MRWKLVIIASLAASLIGCAAWCSLAIGFFGSLSELAARQGALLASLLIPLGLTAFAATFVYRHTARRRKTQATLVILLTLLLTFVMSLGLARWLQKGRLLVPRQQANTSQQLAVLP